MRKYINNTSDHLDDSADKLRPQTDNHQQATPLTGAEKLATGAKQELGLEQIHQKLEQTEHRESVRSELDDIVGSIAGHNQQLSDQLNSNNLNPAVPLYISADQGRKEAIRIVEEKTQKALKFFRMGLSA